MNYKYNHWHIADCHEIVIRQILKLITIGDMSPFKNIFQSNHFIFSEEELQMKLIIIKYMQGHPTPCCRKIRRGK